MTIHRTVLPLFDKVECQAFYLSVYSEFFLMKNSKNGYIETRILGLCQIMAEPYDERPLRKMIRANQPTDLKELRVYVA